MKIKRLIMMGLLCLSLATVALADGDTPITNLDGDTPITNIIETIVNIVTGG